MAVADVNGDGIPDMVVANECAFGYDCVNGDASNGSVSVLLGNGDGTFQPAASYASGGYIAAFVAVADVNGDGKPDLIVTNDCASYTTCANGGVVGVLLGNGDGTFQTAQTFGSGGYGARTVVVEDVNGDGKPDLLIVNFCASDACAGAISPASVGVLFGNGDGTFQPAQTYGSGGYAGRDLVVADVNGDNIPDLVVANGYDVTQTTGQIGVLLGNGDGTYQPAQSYASGGNGAFSVSVADINGDNVPDLVVANACATGCSFGVYAPGVVGVLLGAGGGNFQLAETYGSGGNTAYSIALADVNGDGNPDVLMVSLCATGNTSCSSTDGVVGVMLGNGNGTFQPIRTYDSGGSSAVFLTLGDVNRDGKPDLLVANATSESVNVLLGNGNGTFQATINGVGGRDPFSVAIADVNGDGKPDLLLANYCVTGGNCDNGSVSVLLGNGDGTFQAALSYASGGYATRSVAVGDVNGDGKPDLVLANVCAIYNNNCENGSVSVLLGNGDGTFQAAVSYASSGYTALSVSVGDVNGDGKPDLVVANECAASDNCENGGSVSVLLGNGDGTFQAALSYASGGYVTRSMAVGDVNGDGKPDFVVANDCAIYNDCENGSVSVLLGNGDGTFQAPVTYASGGEDADFVALGDVNGDGKPDLVVANECAASDNCENGSVSVLLGNGDGTFQAAVNYASGGYAALSMAVGDVNGDGKPDLVVANVCVAAGNCENGSVSVLLGNGDGTFQAPVAYASGGEDALFVALGDVNEDGRLDAAVVNNEQSSSVAVLRNIFTAPAASAVNFTSLLSSPVAFQPATFTATVTSSLVGTPTGSVLFTDNGAPIGSASVNSSSQAIFTTSNLGAGPHFIVAYYSGDDSYAPSNSYGKGVNVMQGSTTTGMSSMPNLAVYGQTVILTAHVASTYGAPTGTVTFVNNGTTTMGSGAVSGGVATLMLPNLPVGEYSITACYSGDANFTPSGSSVVQQNVTAASSTLALVSNLSPSVFGQAVTFTAAITPQYGGIATGTVTFKDGNIVIGSGTVSGNVATFTTTALGVGTHTITAVYGGDANVNGSGAGVVSQSVTQATTTTSVVSSVNPALTSESVTFTATVTGQYLGPATGSIIFKSGATKLGTITLSGNQASVTTSFSTAGKDSITAQYVGDINNIGSISSPLSQSVVLKFATTTVVTSSLNPSDINQSVTFTATISSASGSIPNGEVVTFTNGSATLGTGTTMGGIATYITSALTTGSHSIKAAYTGDSTFATSTSAALTQGVDLYPTATMLTASPSPSAYRQSVMLTAAVSSNASSGPTGTVTFKNGSTTLGTATLSGGTASLATTKLGLGSNSLTAIYDGDTQNGTSTSAVFVQMVDQATIRMTLAATPNPSSLGHTVKFTATLTSSGSLPTGTVTFSYNGTTLGTGTIAAGKATFSTTALPQGSDLVTATYAGATDYSSASASVTQTVN